jgi:hypothetical protein
MLNLTAGLCDWGVLLTVGRPSMTHEQPTAETKTTTGA